VPGKGRGGGDRDGGARGRGIAATTWRRPCWLCAQGRLAMTTGGAGRRFLCWSASHVLGLVGGWSGRQWIGIVVATVSRQWSTSPIVGLWAIRGLRSAMLSSALRPTVRQGVD
jgi:hypothetical protein